MCESETVQLSVFCCVVSKSTCYIRFTSSNCKNKHSAKSECFCTFYAFLNEGARTSLYFDERGASFKKGWGPMV